MSSLFVFNSTGCVCPLSRAHRRAEMYNIEIKFSFQLSLHTHKRSDIILSLGENGMLSTDITPHTVARRQGSQHYYGDCTSPSKLLTFLVVYGRLECV